MATNQNPYGMINDAILAAANAQAAAIGRAADITKEIAEKNIAFLTEQSSIARADLAPFMEAGQKGASSIYDLLGQNGAAAQQQYIQGLVQSGSAMAQPTIDLLNRWNQSNNPFNQLQGLVDYAGQVVGMPQAPDAPELPGAPTFTDVVSSVYGNPEIQSAIQKEIDYGTQGLQRRLAAQGLQGSGRELAELQQLGQQTSSGRLSELTGQAAQYQTSNYQTALNALLGRYQTQAGVYGQELASATGLQSGIVAQGMGALNSAYGANTNALQNLWGSAYGQSAGSAQQALLGLTNMGVGAAQSTSQNANLLGQNVSAVNKWTGEAQANAALQFGQVQAQMYQALGQNAVQAMGAGRGFNGLNFM